MSRKKCRRKVWNTTINPVTHALMGAAITPAAELNKLRVKELNAVDAFAEGRATLADFDTACALLNLCEYMASNKVGPEALEACGRAEDALRQAAANMEATGRMELDADGVLALRDVYLFHDLQRQSVSRSEYERAIFKTFERVKNKAPGVVEL